MNKSLMQYMIVRIIDNANDALQEVAENKGDDFYKGKQLAYYEVLNTIKNDLITHDQDLKEFGLDVNLERLFLG